MKYHPPSKKTVIRFIHTETETKARAPSQMTRSSVCTLVQRVYSVLLYRVSVLWVTDRKPFIYLLRNAVWLMITGMF